MFEIAWDGEVLRFFVKSPGAGMLGWEQGSDLRAGFKLLGCRDPGSDPGLCVGLLGDRDSGSNLFGELLGGGDPGSDLCAGLLRGPNPCSDLCAGLLGGREPGFDLS